MQELFFMLKPRSARILLWISAYIVSRDYEGNSQRIFPFDCCKELHVSQRQSCFQRALRDDMKLQLVHTNQVPNCSPHDPERKATSAHRDQKVGKEMSLEVCKTTEQLPAAAQFWIVSVGKAGLPLLLSWKNLTSEAWKLQKSHIIQFGLPAETTQTDFLYRLSVVFCSSRLKTLNKNAFWMCSECRCIVWKINMRF